MKRKKTRNSIAYFKPAQVEYVLAKYAKGQTMKDIADQFGCSVYLIRRLLQLNGVSCIERRSREPVYTPTPEQIKERSAQVREGWSEQQYLERASRIVESWPR